MLFYNCAGERTTLALKTHGEGHMKSKIWAISGTIKWTLGQQKVLKKHGRYHSWKLVFRNLPDFMKSAKFHEYELLITKYRSFFQKTNKEIIPLVPFVVARVYCRGDTLPGAVAVVTVVVVVVVVAVAYPGEMLLPSDGLLTCREPCSHFS